MRWMPGVAEQLDVEQGDRRNFVAGTLRRRGPRIDEATIERIVATDVHGLGYFSDRGECG